jgi:glycosyltransferase involved in cell wall biosynthesis
MASILASYASQHGMDYLFVSFNDPTGEHDLKAGSERFTFHGMGRNKRKLYALLRLARRRKGVVYINHPNLSIFGLTLRLLGWHGAYIVSTHGIEIWAPLPRLRRIGLQMADAVLSPSHFTAEKAASQQNIDRSKLVVLPWGLNTSADAPEPTPNIATEHKFVLTVTRLAATDSYKRVSSVIHAISKVLQQIPNTTYTVVGDGDLRKDLEDQARRLGISENVIFTGICSDAQLAAFYQRCDVFVLPSAREGFGLVFTEAMRFGKPVIASREAATPEVVIDGETGLLTESGDPHELAECIAKVLGEPTLAASLGNAGRARFEQFYTFAKLRDGVVKILDSLQTI